MTVAVFKRSLTCWMPDREHVCLRRSRSRQNCGSGYDKVELGELYFNGGSEPEEPTLLRGRILWKHSTKNFRYLVAEYKEE